MRRVRRALADERDRRGKSEKQLQELARWKEQAAFGLEDLRRKADDLDEARGAERRELRKELARRQEEASVAQAAARKELVELVRSQLAAGGVPPAVESKLEKLDGERAALRAELAELEPRLARLEEGGAALRAQMEGRPTEGELAALRDQMQHAKAEQARCARAAGDALDGVAALAARAEGAERASARQGDDVARVHGMVREVVQVAARPRGARAAQHETCPISTEGWTRRVHFVREGGGGGGMHRGLALHGAPGLQERLVWRRGALWHGGAVRGAAARKGRDASS